MLLSSSDLVLCSVSGIDQAIEILELIYHS